jgi:hypothetical protein
MATRQLNAKLVMCSIPTTNSAAAQQFYNTLLGGRISHERSMIRSSHIIDPSVRMV